MPFPDLKNEIVMLDGALGTMLQKRGMKPGQVPELLNIENPQMLIDLHREYIDAGARIVYANTFGANRLKMAETGFTPKELIAAGIRNVKQAAKEAGKEGEVAAALDIGPIGQLLAPMGSLPFEEAVSIFAEMIRAGEEAGADCIVIETMADLYEVKAALLAARDNSSLPVLVTMTFEENGRSYTGCTLESMAAFLNAWKVDAMGLNCSAGPDILAGHLKKLASLTDLPVIAKPNAGLPDPIDGHYDMDAERFASIMSSLVEDGISLFGGCCGTTPEYIEKTAKKLEGKIPAERNYQPKPAVCTPARTIDGSQVRIIGERINPTGKKRFQQALLEKDFDYILRQAIDQEKAGADLLDVNVGFPGVEEEEMLPAVVEKIQAVLDIPLQLDSTNPTALEKAMRIYNGKPAVNSVNGKKEIMEAVFPLIQKYGASVVGLTIDEEGVPQTAKKRVEIAEKLLKEAGAYGIPKEDLWIDPLCLTVSAEQKQAKETLQALRTIAEEMGLATVLGISNISFGLPMRPVMTRTFLNAALANGLRFPILNPNQIEITDTISAWKVLNGEDEGAVSYIGRFKDRKADSPSAAVLPASEQKAEKQDQDLSGAIIAGLKGEAAKLARKELKRQSELSIVENILIPALDTVGAAYEKGEMYLPQLLSAANASQAVFEVLKDSLLEKGEASVKKGPIVLATVQGDVHDIGKNIVKTVLENYGFEVIDLGKDTDPNLIVDTVKEKNIRLVGLSALMTTTLPAMEKTTKMLKELDNPPLVVVGGAVVTPEYAESIGADFYGKDARETAEIARRVFAEDEKKEPGDQDVHES